MKPEELSIGDWVNIPNYHYDGSHYAGRVDGITKKHDTYYLQFGSALSVEIDKCKPIPLTPEILEKNGFVGKPYAFYKINKHSWLEYYFHELRLQKWLEGVDEWNNPTDVDEMSFQCQCNFVHELQNALRLCKIEKEIEL